jgi:hypothetical protein
MRLTVGRKVDVEHRGDKTKRQKGEFRIDGTRYGEMDETGERQCYIGEKETGEMVR